MVVVMAMEAVVGQAVAARNRRWARAAEAAAGRAVDTEMVEMLVAGVAT